MSTDPHTFQFVRGIGNYAAGTACVVSMAAALIRYRRGESLGEATDRVDCICPIIQDWMIRLNDAPWWESDEERTTVLMPYAERLLNTKANTDVTALRVWRVFDAHVRVFIPIYVRQMRQMETADRLEALPAVTHLTVGQAKVALEAIGSSDFLIAMALALDTAIELNAHLVGHHLTGMLDDISGEMVRYLTIPGSTTEDMVLARGKWLAVADALLEINAVPTP